MRSLKEIVRNGDNIELQLMNLDVRTNFGKLSFFVLFKNDMLVG